jgi:hypothetical protein
MNEPLVLKTRIFNCRLKTHNAKSEVRFKQHDITTRLKKELDFSNLHIKNTQEVRLTDQSYAFTMVSFFNAKLKKNTR